MYSAAATSTVTADVSVSVMVPIDSPAAAGDAVTCVVPVIVTV